MGHGIGDPMPSSVGEGGQEHRRGQAEQQLLKHLQLGFPFHSQDLTQSS